MLTLTFSSSSPFHHTHLCLMFTFLHPHFFYRVHFSPSSAQPLPHAHVFIVFTSALLKCTCVNDKVRTRSSTPIRCSMWKLPDSDFAPADVTLPVSYVRRRYRGAVCKISKAWIFAWTPGIFRFIWFMITAVFHSTLIMVNTKIPVYHI
jgi:hypothetical protein